MASFSVLDHAATQEARSCPWGALKTASETGQDAIRHGMRDWHYAWEQSIPSAQSMILSNV